MPRREPPEDYCDDEERPAPRRRFPVDADYGPYTGHPDDPRTPEPVDVDQEESET